MPILPLSFAESLWMRLYLDIAVPKPLDSPGHNHFWILDDVTNMDVVVGHRGNSIITLFEP